MEISTELRDMKRKQFLEEKRRQLLRENNQELREIEKHLKSAYFVKSLKEQQQQLESKNLDEMRLKEKERLEIEAQRKIVEEQRKQEEIKEKHKKDTFRDTLRAQMAESIHRRQENIEDMALDRDHLEKLLRNLKLEQEKEKKELEERREIMKKELEDFMREQEAYKRKQRELDEEERLRAEEIQRQRDAERKLLEEQKRKERLHQSIISEKIGLEIQKTELEKQRREQLMLELLEEERKAKEDFRFRENLERQVRARERVRIDLERYIEKRKLERELERRNKLSTERAEMERIIAENEKETAKEVQRLREKEQAYNRSIQQMLAERREERAAGLVMHMRDFEFLRAEERKIQQEIEDERMRLLQSHSEVLRYLPTGVLRDTDREFLALPPDNSKSGK